MSGMKTAGLLCTAAAVTKYILLDHVCIQLEDTTSSWHYALNFDNPAPICITASVQGQVLTHECAVICHLQRLSFCQMSCRLSVTRQMFVLSALFVLTWPDAAGNPGIFSILHFTYFVYFSWHAKQYGSMGEPMSDDFWQRFISKPAEPRPTIWTAKRILITLSASLLLICRFIIPATVFIIMIHASPLTSSADTVVYGINVS